jgi:CheY-like chemotaxis protein
MPEGGRLVIETQLIEVDDLYVASHPDVTPGRYAMLAVSDTGCGMDSETRGRIFEPFYSSKGERGTGLGLATVYGIVTQHRGHIWVYSEPGNGTTFKVYLPLSTVSQVAEAAVEPPVGSLTGSETILLAEDNELVRQLTRSILERKGYKVLVAKGGREALSAAERHDQPIHLLLTDVVMPELNGRELYAKAVKAHPELKVLFMSGYTDNVIAPSGILDDGTAFIQKPFSVQALARKVREVIDG